MSRDPSRRGWAARRRAVREADRFSALMATNLCLPLPASRNPPSPVASSSAELSCPRWLFILPAALQPRPDGCALVSPRRRSPPRRRRRGATCASPTKPNAGAMRARVGIHAGGSGGGSRAPVLTAIDATELGLEDEGLTARAGTELTQEQPAGAARRVASRCVASAGTTEQTNGRTNDGCDNVHEPRCSVCAL